MFNEIVTTNPEAFDVEFESFWFSLRLMQIEAQNEHLEAVIDQMTGDAEKYEAIMQNWTPETPQEFYERNMSDFDQLVDYFTHEPA